MARSCAGAFPPIVPTDDNARTPPAGARKGELSVVTQQQSRRRRPPSGIQSDPDDSIRSGSSSSRKNNDDGSGGRNRTMKSHLSNSVYTWACGEKAEGQAEELKASDTVIGWLILLFQALAYGIIILKAKGFREGDEAEEEGDGGSTISLSYLSSSVQDSSISNDIKAYSFASVAAAMYLLVATATPDLRSGFTLLVDGSSARYRLFGVALLSVFGLMITAAMKLLFSDAEDDVGIVTNSVTVLFVADVDEKALTFFLTVPQEWRLFWAMNMLSLSFSLALIFVVYVGDGSAVSASLAHWEGNDEANAFDPENIPSWFVFAVSPAAVTYIAFVVSKGLQAVLDARDGGSATSSTQAGGMGGARRPKPWRLLLWQGLCSAARAIRKDFLFYLILLGWFVVGLIGWFISIVSFDEPLALAVTTSGYSSTSDESRTGVKVTTNLLELWIANAALAIGLAMFAARWMLERRRKQRADALPPREKLGPQKRLSGLEAQSAVELESQDPVRECVGIDERKTAAADDGDDDRLCDEEDETDSCNNNHDAHNQADRPDTAPGVRGEGEQSNQGRRSRSRVPCLLVGWGLGYWATSVVFLLAAAWPKGTWKRAPVYVTVLGCILVPLVFVVGLFMIADASFLGAFLERFLERPARMLNDSTSCAYWTMATMLRSALILWFLYGLTIMIIYEINVF